MTPGIRATDATGESAAPGHGTSAFAVESYRVGPSAVLLALTGELDHDSAPVLEEPLHAALGAAGVDLVVVDCAQLSFCDSTGLNILLVGRSEALAKGIGLRLACLPRVVARMFEITGADTVFEVHPDREQALEAR